MTRDEARRNLMVHVFHTVEDFIRTHDKELADAHPGMEMGVGWITPEELEKRFVEFQQTQLARRSSVKL